MADTETVTIRMPKELKDAIMRAAEEEDRSFNKTVVRMLTTVTQLVGFAEHSSRTSPPKRKRK